jgi:hypothetical protein
MPAPKKHHLSPGDRFQRLVALKALPPRREGTWWLFVCDCGTIKPISVSNVVRGRSGSCGCLFKDRVTQHGMCQHPIYKVWGSLIRRCHSPSDPGWKHYGARGIAVCERWRASFSDFWIDNDQGYEPGNVRWATRAQQSRNRQDTVIIETPSGPKTVTDAAKDAGLRRSTLQVRLDRGWPADKLFIAPTPRQHRNRVSRLWSQRDC